ncbi:MAG TPA: flavodoxin [Gemmatimonadales bacterium]|nr:flavodoxin [Gemmatimonadales bacterium]
MQLANVLVLFYSRSGFTRIVAAALAQALGADLAELKDTTNRAGLLGYLRSGLDAALGRLTRLEPLSKDPTAYSLVVVGTPVWNASVSSPVRTFLVQHGAALRNVAFFCTFGARGANRALAQMAEACGTQPLATMAIRDRELESPFARTRIGEFVKRLEAAATARGPVGAAPTAPPPAPARRETSRLAGP